MYDLIIVGCGAAGLGAGLYAGRYKMKTAIISKDLGGTALEAHKIENYLGFDSITGSELIKKFIEHVKKFDVEVIQEEVMEIKKEKLFKVVTNKNTYESKTTILTTGMKHRKLEIPEEEKFLGRGISYCYTCDGPLFKNKTVAIVGGSNAAATGALMLSEYTEKVYIIYRKESLRAEPITIEKIKENPKIEVLTNTKIKEIKGKEFVESVLLDNEKELKINGLFIEIGLVPVFKLAKDLGVSVNENGFIEVDDFMATNIEGVFAAGDIVEKNKIKQVISAVSEGATAAVSAYKCLKEGKNDWGT